MTDTSKPAPRKRGRASVKSPNPDVASPAKRADAGAARERILVAAAAKFAQHGFDAVSTSEIAKAVGLSQPLIHYHFRTKEDLWTEAIEHMMRRIDERFPISSADLRDLDPMSRARVIIRRFIALSAHAPDLARIMVHEAIADSPRLQWLVDRHVRPRLRALDAAVEQSQESRETKVSSFVTSNAIVNGSSLIFSLGPLIKLVYNVDVTKPEMIEEITDSLVQFFFYGLAGLERVSPPA